MPRSTHAYQQKSNPSRDPVSLSGNFEQQTPTECRL
jgi:hypothetical protein